MIRFLTEKVSEMSEITGRKVLIFTVGAFGIIIAVNLVLAWQAVKTFPGLEVPNSYVASQEFDADRAAQKALGWTLEPQYDAAARQLRLTFTDANGGGAQVATLHVLVGRATEARDDTHPVFTGKDGVFVAPLDLPQGKWMMQILAVSKDGIEFHQRIDLLVRG